MKTKSVVAFLATIFFIFAISLTVSALAQPADLPTADRLEVEDASGKSGTEVEVPVNIENVRNGPVQSIRLIVDYNEYVLNLTSFDSGDLTSNWARKKLGKDRHTVIITTLNDEDAIPNGSSGSVVLLKFHVIGSSGDTSPMNLSRVELSDLEGWNVGTAPVSKGTFTVDSSNGGGGSSGDGGTGGGGSTPTPTPVPTSTPTEKPPAVSEEDEEEKLTETYSPTLAPTSVTPSLATPVQTNASTTPELPAKANPIWVIVLIAVSIIAIIIYVMFKHRKK